MSAKTRVQLTDGDRKVICECRQVNKDLSQEKLTALVAEKLNKPVLKRSTVTGTLKESAKWLSCTTTAANRVKHRCALLCYVRTACQHQRLCVQTASGPNKRYDTIFSLHVQVFSGLQPLFAVRTIDRQMSLLQSSDTSM